MEGQGADDSGPQIRGSEVEVGVDGLWTQTTDWCSPRISTREVIVGVDWPRTEPVRGRYQDQLTHLFLGQTWVCRIDPVRVLSYYKYILDLILDHILFSLKIH